MYCEKCGNKLDYDSKFCDKCGTVIETTDNIKKSKDNVFKKFILPLILVTLFIILIFIGANLILNKHNEKSEEYKQEINEELDKKVIATYDGGKLTDEEFEIYYKMFIDYLRDKKYNESEIPKIVVNKAIIDKLVLTESHKNNIKITQEQEKELNETFESEDFKNLCVNNNIDNEKLKELYRNDYIITNYIEEQAKNLSDSEVITYLKNKYGNDVDLYQYNTQTIMFLNNSEFTAEQNAMSMLNYIKQGADFTEMAKLYSEDEGTRDNGAGVDNNKLGGVGQVVARQLEKLTGLEARNTTLGYMQRGGTPTAFDRVLSTKYGAKAMELALNGQFGVLAVLKNGKLDSVSLEDVVGRNTIIGAVSGNTAESNLRKVTMDDDLVKTARDIGICLGD